MKQWRFILFIGCLLSTSLIAEESIYYQLKNQNILYPLPLNSLLGLNKNIVDLGQTLFFDPRLSRDNSKACASCHQLSQGGDDGLKRSVTIDGGQDAFNTPTVFNSHLNFRQTWRGAFRNLEEQALNVLSNPKHMNDGIIKVLARIQQIPEYRQQFNKNYPEGLNKKNFLHALTEFERSLTTPNSRFDQYLRGNKSAISTKELVGYQLFKALGCVACHHGINLGGTLYQKLGVFKNYFTTTKKIITKADWGRYNVTGKPNDMFVFRVPSLRNVAVTAPYFHDGGISTLKEAVAFMAEGQLGLILPQKDIDALVAFLETLTGEYKNKLLTN